MRLQTVALAFMVILSVSCKEEKKEGYEINGTINGINKGSSIYLDEVSFSGSITTIDTASAGDRGAFSLSGNIKKESLYRLRYGNNKYVLLVLDEKPMAITLEADTADLFIKPYTISGSPASNSLKELLINITGYRKEMSVYVKQLQSAENAITDSMKQALYILYQAKAEESKKYITNFADTVSNGTLAVFAVANFLNPQTDLQDLNIISNKLATKFPANESIKALIEALKPKNDNPYEMTQTFANGTAIPEITGLNPDGKSISLSSLRGKVVLIDFWASWCGPCRAENPNVVNVYNKYKDKGFDVFSYSLDDNKAKWADAIKKDGLIWPAHASQLKGWDSDICEQFNITSIPTNYLIDRNGNVIAFNLHGGALEQILQKVL